MKIPLFGQSGQEADREVSDAYTQNLIPYAPTQSKSQLIHYSTPGLTLFATMDNLLNGVRGSIEFQGVYYCVVNDKLYTIEADGLVTEQGTLQTNTGRVSMAHNGASNGRELCIVDGEHIYILDLYTDGTFPGGVMWTITDPDDGNYDANAPAGATHVVFFDSYFIANDPDNSGRFYVSKPYDGKTWVALSFATAERSPDELQSIVASDKILFLIGTKTTEMWYNAGIAGGVPFKPMQSGFMQWGTIAKYSPTEISGVAFWLTQNDEGFGMIVKSSGTAPEIISTPAIATEIQKMSIVDDAYGWSYQHDQQTYYVITFPSEDTTLVYNLNTKLWHHWSTENFGRHRGNCHTFIYNKHLVGDSKTGHVFYLDWDSNVDYDEGITRIRRSQPIAEGDKTVVHNAVRIEAKTGVADQGLNPKIHLRWRDRNGGWSNWHTRSLGEAGDHSKTITWWGLGESSERVYEIKITDPVDVTLIDAYALLKPGRTFSG